MAGVARGMSALTIRQQTAWNREWPMPIWAFSRSILSTRKTPHPENLDFFEWNDYIGDMNEDRAAMIVPKDFPELGWLAWNRDAARPIDRQEAFELYDRNWRHVDAEHLTPREAALIDDLTREFGHGFRMFA